MQNDLKIFLDLNNIEFTKLEDAVHKDILEAILNNICSFMKEKKENLVQIKSIYRKRPDQIVSTKLVVKQFANCELFDDDLIWMNSCIQAFFRKSDKRKNLHDEAVRLWNLGNHNCAICGKPLTLETLNVDHIIPWDYVGDELSNNYRLLCEHCNKSKSNNIAQSLEKIIFNKQ